MYDDGRQHERQNLMITGNGRFAGGSFRRVRVVGEADFDGCVDCLSFSCIGIARLASDLKSTSCRVVGELWLSGDLETGHVYVGGLLDVGGRMRATDVRSRGFLSVRGDVFGEHLSLDGRFAVCGNCESETLVLKGDFRIDGMACADDVLIRTYGACRVGEIGGHRVDIRLDRRFSWMRWMAAKGQAKGRLEADVIEADEVYVEHTEAALVRGRNIRIGPGCRIRVAEYFERLDVERGSDVDCRNRL